ncbi:bifunctional diguanylate cyclase/phosphodiesterase [Xenophilus azovorans]|uniref:bifunctional diguanylate cyclase/phosphodiesterase n=1 Tax=Xenophilus azovorans TaxID=151755 RepID=UPI00068D1843|nr:EAL domain-containing protein [Xenophilus azovorans]
MNRRGQFYAAAAIFGAVLLFVLAVAAATRFFVLQSRQAAEQAAESQLVRFTQGASAALNQILLDIDLRLAEAGAALRQGPGVPAQADALLRGVTRSDLLVQYAALVSPEGRVLAASGRSGAEQALQLPDGFLARALAQPVAGLVVSAPVISPVTSQQVLYLGRPLRLGEQGRAVAVAEVQAASLLRIINQGVDIRGLETTLERDNGTLLASAPPGMRTARAIGQPLKPDGAGGLLQRLPARLSGVPAIVAARATLQDGLVVAGSLPMEVVLTDWARQRRLARGAAATFILTILGVGWLSWRHWRGQWRQREHLRHSKAMLDQALESMSDGFVLLDAQGRVLNWNRRFVELFPRAEPAIASGAPFAPIEQELALQAAAEEAPQPLVPGEQELHLPDGRVLVIVRSSTPAGGLVCVYRDTTEKRLQMADIIESRAQLQATLDALPDALLELDLDGLCLRFHAARSTSLELDAPVGRTVAELLPGEPGAQIMAAVRDAYLGGVSTGRQFEHRALQGTAWFEVSASRKSAGEGREARFIVILRDITERMAAARQIEHLAFYDNLTGLPNRRLLLHRLQSALDGNQRHQRLGALLFLDLDNFKTLNDAQGRSVGDLLLKHTAERLTQLLGEGDTVARLGGDEFIVMLGAVGTRPEAAALQVQAFGDAVLAELGRPVQLPGLLYHGTASIGAALFGAYAVSLEDLLKQADIAMVHAKKAGGGVLRFFEPDMQASVAARAALESELHAALKSRRQFTLHYQRQVTAEGQIIGAEVLIRWNHPERGQLLPAAFIDVAEETGLIVPIGLWALEQACRQLDEWSHHPRRRHLTLAVNVSARQFRRDDFAEQVREVLIRTGADPSRLKLELTESLLHEQLAETVAKMKSLAAIGIRFAMDDFGIGYSSLSYMAQLPLAQIKIDKFFVGGIGNNAKIELIVQTLIGMAANLDLEIVAEGVETREQLDFLVRHGCRMYQGFFFGRPLTFEELEGQLDVELAPDLG